MTSENMLEHSGGDLIIPQTDLTTKQQHDFTKALDTGDPVYYLGRCWTIIGHYGLSEELKSFVLTQVPMRECNQARKI